MMTLSKRTTISVQYENHNGYHYFKSDDLKGLFIGDRDFDTAFEDVSKAIEILMFENHKVRCKAEPEMTPEEFQVGQMLHYRDKPRPFSVVAA